MTNPIIDAAKDYLSRGWSPIRLHGLTDAGLCTCSDGAKPGHERNAGKHPTDKDWQDQGLESPEGIDEAYAGWRANHNVGIRTGRPSGFFVLDVDPDNGGFDSVRKLQADFGTLPATVVQKTGSGGFHLLFLMPEDFEPTNRRGGLKEYPGLDIRGTGGQIVAAPSRSAKGPYAWKSELDGAVIAEAPDWLLELLRPKASTAPVSVAPATVPAAEGITDAEQQRLETYSATVRDREVGRLVAMREAAGQQPYQGEPWNQTTFDVACSLIELANSPWTLYDMEQAFLDVTHNAPSDEGFGKEEIDKCWRSALNKVGDNARPLPEARQDTASEVASWLSEPGVRVDPILLKGRTPPPNVTVAADPADEASTPMRTWDDLGNAMRIVDHFGQGLRWVDEVESWAVFRKGRWKLVRPNVVQGLIQRMIDQLVMVTEGAHYPDVPDDDEKPEETPRKRFEKWLKSQRMSARIAAAQKEAQGRYELYASKLDFDAKPFLFNAANGVIDLQTGALHPADPALLMMRQSSVAYDPDAKCPQWMAFLERVMPDPEMRQYLQKVLGYSITGDTREQAFFLHHGEGANGKSVMTGVMGMIMADYGVTIAPTTLLSSGQEEHPTGLAMMEGRRWLLASETAPGKRLDEQKVKNFTGDSTVTARYMGKDFFEYEPIGKIHLITNHLPRLSDAKSIWRRIHLLKWGVIIPLAEQDRTLEARLKETELSGILNWLVEGTQLWLAEGLQPPVAAINDLMEYRDDSDTFGEFLRTRTARVPDHKTPTDLLYRAYTTWAWDQGTRKPMSQQAFVAALRERGLERYRDAKGRGFVGIVPFTPAKEETEPLPWAEDVA